LALDTLKSNPKISAVLFTTEEFNEKTNEYVFGVRIIKNDSAILEIPENYYELFTL